LRAAFAAGYRHGDHPFALMGGRQAAAGQVLPARYFRSGHVRGPAGWRAKRELDEAGRDLAGIDRLDTKPPGTGATSGNFASFREFPKQ
jgi:hypothetical protein